MLSAEGGVATQRVKFCTRDCGAGIAPALPLPAEPGCWRNQKWCHTPPAPTGRLQFASSRQHDDDAVDWTVATSPNLPQSLSLTSLVWSELSAHL